jgi:hypothetical protein
MATRRDERHGDKPNIYPLGHPSRVAGGVVQNKPTPQPARKAAAVVTPAPAATAPAAPVEAAPAQAPATGTETTTLNESSPSTANTAETPGAASA